MNDTEKNFDALNSTQQSRPTSDEMENKNRSPSYSQTGSSEGAGASTQEANPDKTNQKDGSTAGSSSSGGLQANSSQNESSTANEDSQNAETTKHYKDRNRWIRLLYMVLFVIIFEIAKNLVYLITLIQFIVSMFKDEPIEELTKFSQSLSTFIYNTSRFLMYNSEQMPFPFEDWRNQP